MPSAARIRNDDRPSAASFAGGGVAIFARAANDNGAGERSAANALNQYPSVGGYPYTYWPEGGLKQTDTLAANDNEFGKLTLAYLTPAPGTIDPNNFDFMGIDALDHVYFHGRQTTAGDTHPFIYHSTDGLRPETIWEWQCTQTGGATPVCAGTGTGTRFYVLGPDPDERWAFTGVSGGLYAPHTDREGTLIALANGGAVSHIYTWDAYGQNTAPASDTGAGATGYLYRYTGQRYDPNTGLHDYKARDYSPVLGRFLQPDPAGLDQGPNLYEYVENDPVDKTDPTGQDAAAAAAVLSDIGKLDFGEEVLGGGPEDPVADAAAAVTTVGGLAVAGYKLLQPGAATISESRGGKNRLPPVGPPNTTKTNKPKTQQIKYGPDGRPVQEWNKGHPGYKPPEDQDHVHDHLPRPPQAPPGAPIRQPGRPPGPGDLPGPGNPSPPPPTSTPPTQPIAEN